MFVYQRPESLTFRERREQFPGTSLEPDERKPALDRLLNIGQGCLGIAFLRVCDREHEEGLQVLGLLFQVFLTAADRHLGIAVHQCGDGVARDELVLLGRETTQRRE